LISWQCKKQTMVATSTTEAEYVAAASCCGQDKQCSMTELENYNRIISQLDYFITAKSILVLLGQKVNTASTNINAAMLPLVLLEGNSVFLITVEIFKALTSFIGEVEIKAIVDGHDKTITEASVRSSLQLADADGISNMSTTELFEHGLVDEATFTSVDVDPGGDATTDIGLDAKDFHFVTPTKISASGEAHSLDISPEDQLGVLNAAKILADAGKSDTVPKTVSEVQTYTKRRRDVIDVNTGSEAVNIASDFFSGAKDFVNNDGDSIPVKDKDPGQREGKAVMEIHALQNRSFSVAEVRKNMCTYLKNQGGYKQSHFKGMSYEYIRHIFESIWDQNHAFVPKDYEIEKEVMKRPGFDLQKESINRNEKIEAPGFVQNQTAREEKGKKKDAESSKQVKEEIIQQEDVVAEQVVKESSKNAGGRLKTKVAKARDDKDKRQKMQDDSEKLTLMEYVEVISNFEEIINVIPLAVKSPIVNWKSYCKGDVGYYEIHRADGSYKTYIYFSEMLNDFDREDLIVLTF
ncbi:hypothetical protein Tco_1007160, partial [Tanacetum coccineum]